MCPTGSSLADLRSAFEILDVDRDGRISHGDLKTFYADADAGDGDDVVATMMTLADLNNDGFVEYEEFDKVVSRSRSRSNDVMAAVFHAMDRDGDGKLGHGDLRSYLGSAGIQANDDDINAMLRLGSKGDAGVTFQGFLKIFAI